MKNIKYLISGVMALGVLVLTGCDVSYDRPDAARYYPGEYPFSDYPYDNGSSYGPRHHHHHHHHDDGGNGGQGPHYAPGNIPGPQPMPPAPGPHYAPAQPMPSPAPGPHYGPSPAPAPAPQPAPSPAPAPGPHHGGGLLGSGAQPPMSQGRNQPDCRKTHTCKF